MSLVQMNVRIDDEVRVEGNRAFESIGWTPSQAARELWGYAARNRRSPRRLQALCELLAPEDERAEAGAPSPEILRGPAIVREFRASQGLSPACGAAAPVEELREEALLERWRERGLL